MTTMQRYVGVKLINAKPMSRQAYNDFRGWALPANENGDDPGYLVEYIDGGIPNTKDFAGYVSWSPAEVFNNAYKPVTGMPFSQALEAVKAMKTITRQGWNGRGQFVFLIPGNEVEGQKLLPYLALSNVQGEIVPWLASQGDLLADDWVVEE